MTSGLPVSLILLLGISWVNLDGLYEGLILVVAGIGSFTT